MSPSAPTTQSPAERRAAEAESLQLIAKHAPEHQKLVASMRRAIRKRLPTAHELVYEYTSWIAISYSPTAQGFQGVLAIRADADEVKLHFAIGRGLPDPDKLLQGSGLTRWILVEGISTLARPAVVKFIEGAIKNNRVPFPRSGKGPVVIQSSAKKKAKKRR